MLFCMATHFLQVSPFIPINLRLKKTIKISHQSKTDVQAVVFGGKLYIADYGYFMKEYTIEGGAWRNILTPSQMFGMAVVNDQLIITGGLKDESNLTDQVWVLDSVTDNWTQPYPAMPTAKASPAVGYKRWVLVVEGESRCVEVLDTFSKQWFVATSLPNKVSQHSLMVFQDTLCIIGELTAFSVPIPALIADAMTQVTKWQQIPALKTGSTTVVLPDTSQLIIFGGKRGTIDICDIILMYVNIILAALDLFVFCLVGKSLGNCVCQLILWVIYSYLPFYSL